MSNEKQLTRISKFLSLILRHQPDTIGLTLDEEGWANVAELLTKSNDYGVQLDRALLEEVVATNAKKRFAFSSDEQKIRASQGHSIKVTLGYTNTQPPDILYHGTGKKSVASILSSGLEKRSRQHVHLSADRETAMAVGQRHGVPHIFIVKALEMYQDGHEFYLSDNGVWLTDNVPVQYLRDEG